MLSSGGEGGSQDCIKTALSYSAMHEALHAAMSRLDARVLHAAMSRLDA